jgi:hypothetical protein
LPAVEGHTGGAHGVIAPGFNPKEKPEQFVQKILSNQKRMEYTIKKFEEEEKAKFRNTLVEEER